jgi:hypothetical protein
VVKFQRELAGRNRGDRWVPFELACALYVEALSDQSKRAALLHEAAGLNGDARAGNGRRVGCAVVAGARSGGAPDGCNGVRQSDAC